MKLYKYSAIELYLSPDNQVLTKCCSFDKSGKHADVTLVQAEGAFPAYVLKSACTVIIHGKGVLYRNTKSSNNLIIEEEVYSQIYSTDSYSITSFIRKETLGSVIQPLLDKKIPITKIIIGPAILLNLKNIQTSEGYFHPYLIDNSDSLNPKISPVSPDLEVILKNEVFFQAAETLLNPSELQRIQDSIEMSLNLKNSALFYLFYKKVQIAALVLFLVLLLINFTAYNHYFNNTAQIEETSSLSGLQSREDSLKRVLSEQKKRLQKFSYNKPRESLYTDQIFSSLPQEVKLTDYSVNPEQFMRNENSYSFENNKIILIGYSANSYVLNQWLQQLEREQKIIKSNFKSYLQEFDNPKGRFEIELYPAYNILKSNQTNE